jgi:hypothetical protein
MGPLPLLLTVYNTGYINCSSFSSYETITEGFYEKVNLNLGANDTIIVPIELNVCTNTGFENPVYSLFLSVNVINRNIELISLTPGYPSDRMNSVNKYLSYLFNKQHGGQLFYVGINMTPQHTEHLQPITVFSGICFFYKSVYNTLCPVHIIAKDLSKKLQLIDLKLTDNSLIKSDVLIDNDNVNRRESLGANTEIS